MEKQVNEIISKIMKSKNFSADDLNEIVKLHNKISKEKFEYQMNHNRFIDDSFNLICCVDEEEKEILLENKSSIFERQLKRLEMVLRDKLKQINIYLKDDYLEYLENLLFHRDEKADIKDLRLINKNEIAIIRENSIQLGDLSYNADNLSAGMCLDEEAYLQEFRKTGKEPENWDPSKVFSCFYEDMYNKISYLKEILNIIDKDVDMYFDRNLDSFYLDNPNFFRVILTELPDKIEIYEVKVAHCTTWVPKKISGSPVKNYMDSINFSLLEEDAVLTNLKKNYKGIIIDDKVTNFDIEMVLDRFKQTPFSLEQLITTYNSLFSNNCCMSKENKSAINRLKFITAEKYVEQGFEYEKAFNYTETLFKTIQDYKKQIMSAINGENKFPEDSLVGVVKKLKYPEK